jgi:hypothetical protein
MKARDLIIEPCALSEIRSFVETNHYSHSVNGVKISQCFKVLHDGMLVGGVIFGALSTTAWKKFGAKETDVLELRRLVLLDEAERNSESRVIGFCLRWVRKNMSTVKTIVSYADPAHGHEGVIYRASNFSYVGKTPSDKGFTDPETGKTYHSRALRTKYNGTYKPFAMRLRDKLAKGQLVERVLPGKHCYTYQLHPLAGKADQ